MFYILSNMVLIQNMEPKISFVSHACKLSPKAFVISSLVQ